MSMDLVLHFPSEQRTLTVRDVVFFETEFGSTSIVSVEQSDGSHEEYQGVGLTVSAGSESGRRLPE